jgi:methyl-accepting chemotaxis protein
MPRLQAAFAAEDRAALQGELTASLAALRASHGVQSIVFFRAPATAFFRIHEPAKFGDDAGQRRQMVLRGTEKGETSAGIEPGRAGLFMFGTVPIEHEGRRLGALDVGLPFGKSFAEAAKRRLGVDVAIHFRVGDGFKTVATTLPEGTLLAAGDLRDGLAGTPVLRHLRRNGRPFAAYAGPIRSFSGEPVAVVEIVRDASRYAEVAQDSFLSLLLATLAVLILAVGAAGLMTLGLSRPLKALTRVMDTLARGNAAPEVPGLERRDEIGTMARAVDVLKQGLLDAERLRREQEAARLDAAAEQKATLSRMADDFERSVGGVVERVAAASTEMQGAAESLLATADAASRQAAAVSAAATQATANVQTVATAAEELSSSVGEVGRQVTQSSEIAGAAVADARRTDATVARLDEAAQRIGEVVGLIQDIAGRTNLLALNATIEAARAGAAGKGFAVVASEVKSLAGQTGKATEEISSQIAAIQGATRETVEAIRHIGATIGRISDIASTVTAAIEEQGTASGLSQQSERLRREVASFLASVRAA